jgi:signal recognition particle subunit SRP54
MFESLQQGLISALRTFRGRGKLTEANMRDGLRLVQQALLEADVSYPVVKEFMARVTEKAVGEQVLKSLDPTQQLVGIVYQELVNLMGPVDHSLHLRPPLTVLMLCGLQGSGKTTTCAKLAKLLQERQKKPMMVAADLQRPAAIRQLQVLGENLGVPVYVEEGASDPVAVCQNAVRQAKQSGIEVAILDTAGRLHIDEELMQQLGRIERRLEPEQVYFVVDAMTGQDAVNSAKAFNEALELDGVILTKLDGDARGGAALSVKHVTGVPIKFIGTGEHIDALEEFHPDRMAGRILGMGDMLSLIEQAQRKFDQEEMARQTERLMKGQFTLDDFRKQLGQTKKLGPLNKVLSLIPGMSQVTEMMGNVDAEGDLRRMGGIIDSMTAEERRNPKLIDQSRRRRIAAGSGVEPHEVNELVKNYEAMADLMKKMATMSMRDRMRTVQQLTQGAMANPGGRLVKEKKGTGKRLTSQERAKLRRQREKELRRRKREEKRKGGDGR